MKNIGNLLLITTFVFFISCNKKIDNPQLIETLQKQVDSVMKQGYQIDNIDIYSKEFSDHGPSDVGYFDFMFICAASPDLTIKYLANFSYSAVSNKLTFHGYPTDPNNKREDKIYDIKPNLLNAISKLDEIKKQIPDNYTYENLLHIKYFTVDREAVYEFKIELKPVSENFSHPNVKQEEKSYVKYTTTRTRQKFGTTKEINNTEIKRKIQHTITFRLIDNQIKIH